MLEAAETLLMIPDLINYWLTGREGLRVHHRETSSYWIPAGGWARDLLRRLGLPARIFPPIVQPAHELGPLLPGVAEGVGRTDRPLPPSPPTTPPRPWSRYLPKGEDFAYISSGTWSLVGVELPGPVMTEEGLRANFTNEGGFGGTTRFLKNVMGLWLLQECRRTWAEGWARVLLRRACPSR